MWTTGFHLEFFSYINVGVCRCAPTRMNTVPSTANLVNLLEKANENVVRNSFLKVLTVAIETSNSPTHYCHLHFDIYFWDIFGDCQYTVSELYALCNPSNEDYVWLHVGLGPFDQATSVNLCKVILVTLLLNSLSPTLSWCLAENEACILAVSFQ